MSGEDANKPKPGGTARPLFETMDFSATTNLAKPDQGELTLKANGTQAAQWDTPRSEASMAADSTALPSDIPGFKVEREIGRGAFGVVYAAHDEMLERKVAIKKPIISDPIHRRQYIDEARKAVKLEHPGIVPIYHVGTTSGGEPFVVQKLIEGSSLRGLLKDHDNRLPIIQIVSIMRQVCLAVDAAHSAGMVHRDLKPENLLIEPDGRAYVADFGLAILEDEEQEKKGREIAGTPFYMSPEQFSGRNEWLDGRSDIWALGVIFYELLSGKTPFSGKTIGELKDEIRNKDPRPIHQRDPNIPSAFDTLFRKCCAKQVSDRFGSVHELIAELDTICKTLMLDPIEWERHLRSGSGISPSSRGGSPYDTSRDSLTGRGLSTHRSMHSTVRGSLRSSILREPSIVWSLIGPILTTVLTLSAVVSGAWYLELGPFAAVQPMVKPPPVVVEEPLAEVSQKPDPSPSGATVDPIVVLPAKPFVVAIKGEGTHDSISQAIADSSAGETISIRDGTYRESLIIDRSIKLVGMGDVRIMAADKACMEIRADSAVEVEMIKFECQSDEQNTIDLFGGQLHLSDCEIYASSPHSHDCVRARSNTVFIADRCQFQSMEHAAIYGDPNSKIVVRDSKFRFPGNLDFGLKRVGIQATGAEGDIRGCVFNGPCIAGIDWMDNPDHRLNIESCQITNCSVGIQARNCSSVNIKGTVDQPCEIHNARFGMNLEGSVADLQMLNIQSVDDKDKVGLQISNHSKVTCDATTIAGMQCGLLVNQSECIADTLIIRENSFTGMLVDDSSVEVGELRLIDVGDFGMIVLSTSVPLSVGSLEIEAVSFDDQKFASAVYAASGEIRFQRANFLNCLCAVCLDSERKIIESIGYPKKSILDVLKISKRSDAPLPRISGEELELKSCEVIWMFLGTGTSQIRKITGDLPASGQKPRLIPPEALEIQGTDLSDFSVISKTKGD